MTPQRGRPFGTNSGCCINFGRDTRNVFLPYDGPPQAVEPRYDTETTKQLHNTSHRESLLIRTVTST